MDELKVMGEEVSTMLKETHTALRTNDPMIAQNMIQREGRINELQVRFKERHLDRLNRGKSKINTHFIFLDFIDNRKRIADHLTNVVQGVIGKMQ